jgi:hypothetical protein
MYLFFLPGRKIPTFANWKLPVFHPAFSDGHEPGFSMTPLADANRRCGPPSREFRRFLQRPAKENRLALSHWPPRRLLSAGAWTL